MSLLSSSLYAGFNFGECSGSGTFEQEIVSFGGDYENAATVGEIPAGIKGLKISLRSNRDVDIRLYGENDDKIAHWPFGIMNKYYAQTKPYKGVPVSYSGYNGINGKKGHEYIRVDGTTPTIMTMKAFGYKAGFSTVDYSWTGKVGCVPGGGGNGSFTQELPEGTSSLVGTIPPNVDNVEINLTSDKDLDIQLFGADGTAIVSWKPQGLLSGPSQQSIVYHGMTITWSGYAGVNQEGGHEYIKIEGNTTEMLVMKVYGYEAGSAEVTYSWGDGTNDSDTTPPVITLNGDSNVTVVQGNDYIDAGATATDDRDGNVDVNISGNVDTDIVGVYTITYSAVDSAGNAAVNVIRTVNVTLPADTTPPVITLNGDSNVTIVQGSEYIELGATAVDDRDGNITDDVVVTSDVNSSVEGEYTVKYNVHDAAGNKADTVTRVVHVEASTYGSKGRYMDEVKVEETDDYIVYYPENHVVGAPLVLFSGYYKATGEGEGKVRNEGAMRYLASLGCYVIGNRKKPTHWYSAEDFLAVFNTVNLPILTGVNKNKFAIVGHSAGGMASYYMMKYFKAHGYGETKSFIIDIHGYYASNMSADDLTGLSNVDSLILLYGGNDGTTPDNLENPRPLLTISHLLPEETKKAFIVLPTKTHYYHWGEYDEKIGEYNPIKTKIDFLKPIDAMVKYEFFNDNGNHDKASEILFDGYNETYNAVNQATQDYLDGGEEYRYKCLINLGIDYCRMKRVEAKKYPPTTTLTPRGTDDTVMKPEVDNPATDPTFQTRIYKVDKADKHIVDYPKRQSWNNDMTLIRISNRLYDATTLKESKYTKGKENPWVTLCSRAADDFRWSTKDPHKFFVIDSNYHLIQGKINTNDIDCSNVLETFAEFEEVNMGPGEGNIDYNDQYLILQGRKLNDNKIYLILYDIKNAKMAWDTPKILSDDKWQYNEAREIWEPENMDWISVSPSGHYIVLNNETDRGTYKRGVVRFDLNMSNEKSLYYAYNGKRYSEGDHGDMGFDIDGNEVYVNLAGGVAPIMYDLDHPDNNATYLLNQALSGHVSCRNYKRPGWCYFSSETEVSGYGEVFAMKLDKKVANKPVQRFTQIHRWDHSYYKDDDDGYKETYGAPSPDGTKVIFNSHWGNANKADIDTFIAEVK